MNVKPKTDEYFLVPVEEFCFVLVIYKLKVGDEWITSVSGLDLPWLLLS